MPYILTDKAQVPNIQVAMTYLTKEAAALVFPLSADKLEIVYIDACITEVLNLRPVDIVAISQVVPVFRTSDTSIIMETSQLRASKVLKFPAGASVREYTLKDEVAHVDDIRYSVTLDGAKNPRMSTVVFMELYPSLEAALSAIQDTYEGLLVRSGLDTSDFLEVHSPMHDLHFLITRHRI